MKYLKVFFLVLLLTSSAFAQRNFAGKVVEVVDGKTFVMELTGGGKMTAALQYVEVPESDQPLAAAIRDHLRQLVFGKVVEFRATRISTDVIIVGQLMLGLTDISQQMLRDGAAWHIPEDTSGQDVTQNSLYAENQARAKNEKLGVWSVPGLKPAWEYRAEIAARQEEEKKKQKELEAARIREEEEALDKANALKRQKALEGRQQKNSQMSFWPEIQREIRDSSTGIAKGYDPVKKYGYYETKGQDIDISSTAPGKKFECRALYVYYGAEDHGNLSSYILAFAGLSKDILFARTKKLIVSVDGKKLDLGVPKTMKINHNGVDYDLIFFKADDDVMQEIAYADKLDFKLGAYGGTINNELKNSMRHLLLAKK